MELNTKKTSSQALLTCGNAEGLNEKLLLKPKTGTSLQTERIPRSSVLERLQNFLPQMAEANKKLKQEMEDAPVGRFDIENVDETERAIVMDVALVELDGSDTDSEVGDDTSESDESSDSESEDGEISKQKLKLPGHDSKKKVDIQVLEDKSLTNDQISTS